MRRPNINSFRNRPRAAVVTVLTAGFLALLPNATIPGTAAAQSAEQVGPKFVVIPVDGMICISCAASVKRAIKSMQGVSNVEVSLEDRTARVAYTPTRLSPQRIAAVIDKLGYKAGEPRDAK